MTKGAFRKRLGTRAWAPIVLVCLVIVIALAFNLMGVHIMNGLPAWQEWRADTYWHFVAWRMALYSLAVWGWLQCRDRLFKREPSAKPGVRKAEVAVLLSFLLMELTRTVLRPGA